MKPIVPLQIIRAIAAWLVVFHHYMQIIHGFKYTSYVGYLLAVHGAFGVDVFFVLSGFVMCYTMIKHNYSAYVFMVNRVIRVVPAYWFFTFLLVPLAILMPSGFAFTAWGINSIALSLLFVPHENPSGVGYYPFLTVGWTLNFEMFFYFIMSASIFVFKKKWMSACLIMLLIFPLVWPGDWPLHSILTSPLLFEFFAGMVICYVYYEYGARARLHWLVPLFVVVGAIILRSEMLTVWIAYIPFLWRFYYVFSTMIMTTLLPAAMLVVAAIMVERYLAHGWLVAGMKYLGDISYSTYLAHVLVLGAIQYYLVISKQRVPDYILLPVAVVLIAMLAHYGYKLIEVGPLAKYLKYKLIERNA